MAKHLKTRMCEKQGEKMNEYSEKDLQEMLDGLTDEEENCLKNSLYRVFKHMLKVKFDKEYD